MFDITKWFKKETPIDVNVLQSMTIGELHDLARNNGINTDGVTDKNILVGMIKVFVEKKKEEQEDKPAERNQYLYMCEEECTYLGKFRKVGDIVTLPEKKTVPHFKFVDDEKK